MGNSNTKLNKEDDYYKKFLKPGIKLSEIKNLSKAYFLLDNENKGYILYDIDKMIGCKNRIN